MEDEGLPDEEVKEALSSRLLNIPEKVFCFQLFLPLPLLQLILCLSLCVLQKVMRRSQHARKETEFLRLKRTRLGLDDFESLKVIGRGAFGEVHKKKRVEKLFSGLYVVSVVHLSHSVTTVLVSFPVFKQMNYIQVKYKNITSFDVSFRFVWCRKKTRGTFTP